MSRQKKSPLNQSEIMLGWEDLSKVLDLDLLRAGMKRQRAGDALPAAPPQSTHGAGGSMAVSAAPSKL